MKRKNILIVSFLMASVLLVACGETKADVEKTSEDNKVAVENISETENEQNESQPKTPELTIEGMREVDEEIAPDLDIDGCDTFTQIVDQKLEAGMGYTNIDFGDTNVLMVTSGTYDNLDGNMASIDATLFIYRDGIPEILGKISSGGTAYPLATDGTFLYSGGNHYVCKYSVTEDGIQGVAMAAVDYDSNGDAYYYCESETDPEYANVDSSEAEKRMNDLYDEMFSCEVINFDTISE